jgi:hypothetical protein
MTRDWTRFFSHCLFYGMEQSRNTQGGFTGLRREARGSDLRLRRLECSDVGAHVLIDGAAGMRLSGIRSLCLRVPFRVGRLMCFFRPIQSGRGLCGNCATIDSGRRRYASRKSVRQRGQAFGCDGFGNSAECAMKRFSIGVLRAFLKQRDGSS